MATYYTLLTNIGQAKIANALTFNQTVNWSEIAVGDGNGNPTTPVQTQTALVRETYRAPINHLTVDPENPNYMVAELIVPTNVGGWTVYEVGIFDAEGDMVAVANFPATYKPQLSEGSGRDLVVRIIIQVSNASVVTLKVDPAIVLASQKWVVENFVRKVTVAGGTTGQVLAKNSNANEDFKWIDPTAAVNVIVDSRQERQTLASAQTVVNLAALTSQAIAVYIEGARLIETVDYTVNSNTQLTLARSYPSGTRIHMYQNDPTSLISNATENVRGFVTLATEAEALAGTNDTDAMTPLKVLKATSGRLVAVRSLPAGAYVPTPGTKNVLVMVQGGGGAGGGAQSTATGNTAAGIGGTAGAYAEGYYPVELLTGQVVTIGQGGVGVANGNGGNGGTTSFGSVISAPGGPGGAVGVNSTIPWLLGETGNSGLASGGNIRNECGESGAGSFCVHPSGITSGRGGNSRLATGGSSRGSSRGNGFPGTGRGAGGSGAVELSAGPGALAGGNGIQGDVIVWEFK